MGRMGGVMDFEAFKNLPAAEGEKHGPYQRLFDIFHEWNTIFAKFGGIPATQVLTAREIQGLFTRNQWENKSEQDIANDIKWYSAELTKMQNKQAILEEIAAKIGDMGDQRVKSDFIHPSMRLLLDDNIDTQKLEAIRGALNGLDAKALQGLMRTYRDLASEISVLRKLGDDEKGVNREGFISQYKNLFRSLAEYESGKDIMPLLTAALGEAQTLHRTLGLSAGYFINVADFERQHPGEYRQIFEAIAAQNTSSENSPPVEQIELWLQGWENSDDPEGKIRLYLKELTQPGNEKTSVAEGDTLLSAAPTDETSLAGVSPAAAATATAAAPAPAAEAAAEAAAPAAEAASEPTSQQRQNPFQKLGQTILSLPVISQIKRGVLGLAAAAVIATDPLQKLINKHRKGLLISGSVVAGVLGLGVLAAKNLGSGPAAPVVDLAKNSHGNPIINLALETTKNDFTKTKTRWVSLERYLGMPNVDIINNNPPNNAAIEKALITLKASMAKGGMASDNQAVKGATRESIEKIAELTGIDKQGFVKAYTDARDAVKNDAHTQAVYHEKMGKALDALSEKITASRSSEGSTVTFSGGHGVGGGNEILIASGPVSDVSSGFLPVQHASPIQSFLSHTRQTMSAAMQHVGGAAQHVSHAVGQVVKSEPVQAALHNSATYTAVSLAVTATSVRFQAVREARQAEAEKIDGPELSFAANARGLARDFFTRDVGGPAAYRDQLGKATTKVALGRAAFAAICPPVAIAATAMGVTAFGAGVVHHVTKDNKNLATVAAASEYLAKMEYVNQATRGVTNGFTAAKTFATQAASSPLVTQAMEVTQTTMKTATNVVQSTRDRVAAFFTQRHAAAAL